MFCIHGSGLTGQAFNKIVDDLEKIRIERVCRVPLPAPDLFGKTLFIFCLHVTLGFCQQTCFWFLKILGWLNGKLNHWHSWAFFTQDWVAIVLGVIFLHFGFRR